MLPPPPTPSPITSSADIWAGWMAEGEYDLADELRAARRFSYNEMDRAQQRLDDWNATHAR